MKIGIAASIGIVILIFQACSVEKLQQANRTQKPSPYQQIDFQSLMKRYMDKSKINSVEGIYSVSGSVTKKGKGFLGSVEKEKTTDRQENYARVAIIQDTDDKGRDFIELSLGKENQASYSVIGEFNTAKGSSILLYRHIDAKNKSTAYTFTTDPQAEVLEGIRVETEGNSTVTYKLTYLKIYPK